MCCPRYPMRILIAALISALVASAQPRAAADSDSHRPACVDAQCRKICRFLKHIIAANPHTGTVGKMAVKSRFQKDPALALMLWQTSNAIGATQNERWTAISTENRPPTSAAC